MSTSRAYPISAWANVSILGEGPQCGLNKTQKEPTTQQSNENFGTGPLFEAIRVSKQGVDAVEDSIEVTILKCLGLNTT